MFISGDSIFRAEAWGWRAVLTLTPPLYSLQRACPAGRTDRPITRRTAWDIAAHLRDGHVRPQVRVSVMADLLLKLILGPLLLLQGWHIRRATARLPVSGGDRRVEQGSGPPLRLVSAGDSSAAGVGLPDQSEALAGQLAERLASHYLLHCQRIARSGVDTVEVTELLQA